MSRLVSTNAALQSFRNGDCGGPLTSMPAVSVVILLRLPSVRADEHSAGPLFLNWS